MKRTMAFALTALTAGMLLVQTQGRAAETADTYPSKPIRIIAPFAPGALTDRLARIISTHMAAHWNQTIIVENRAGGQRRDRHRHGGNLAAGRLHLRRDHQRPRDQSEFQHAAV
ncbi:MAG: hypothetical protein WDN48_10125 [Pseudolabrys sp.]